MSKRNAPVQGRKEGSGFLGDGSEMAEMEQTPKKATAAQMASRK